jgi:hypothetical protein
LHSSAQDYETFTLRLWQAQSAALGWELKNGFIAPAALDDSEGKSD